MFKPTESHGSLSKIPNTLARNFNMLHNVNVIQNEFLYRNYLLIEVYKYLMCRFYLVGQFVSWYFENCGDKV